MRHAEEKDFAAEKRERAEAYRREQVRFAISVVLTLPLSVTIVATIAKRSQAFFIGQQKALGALNGHVAEMYSGHVIVTAFGHEAKSVATFDQLNAKYHDGAWKAQARERSYDAHAA